MAHKYEIPSLSRDVAVYLSIRELTFQAVVVSQKIIYAKYSYVLGASFDVQCMEDKNREHVVNNFPAFLDHDKGETWFNSLIKWCPDKLYRLVHDAVVGSGNAFSYVI